MKSISIWCVNLFGWRRRRKKFAEIFVWLIYVFDSSFSWFKYIYKFVDLIIHSGHINWTSLINFTYHPSTTCIHNSGDNIQIYIYMVYMATGINTSIYEYIFFILMRYTTYIIYYKTKFFNDLKWHKLCSYIYLSGKYTHICTYIYNRGTTFNL